MNVRYACYPVRTLGPGERLGIWVTGCRRRCPGCMSPELADSVASDAVGVADLLRVLAERRSWYEGVTVSGGEPFDQPGELAALLAGLRPMTGHVLVYTGYRLEELRSDPACSEALAYVDVLVDGPYERGLDDGRGVRGSTNQRVIRLGADDGYDYEGAERASQTFVLGDVIFVAGLA